MRKTLAASAAALLFCIAASAQTASTVEKIEKLNSGLTTVEGQFTMTKTLAANGKKSTGEGKIYFESPDKMALIYSTPASDHLVINGNKLYLAKGDKKNIFDTTKNATMRSLSKTLINCTVGKIQSIADDNDAEVSVKEGATTYDILIKARKKAARGYSEIALSYRKSDGLLCTMSLTEFNGNKTDYTFTGAKTGVKVAPNVFIVATERKAAPDKPIMYEVK